VNFNRRSARLAAETGKPLVGNSDTHYLWQLNWTFTWIYSEPDMQSVFKAIKQGLVQVETSPLSWFEAATWWAIAIWRSAFPASADSLNKIENGRSFGTAQEIVEPESIHVGHQGQEIADCTRRFHLPSSETIFNDRPIVPGK
jgi:hypothetical protein